VFKAQAKAMSKNTGTSDYRRQAQARTGTSEHRRQTQANTGDNRRRRKQILTFTQTYYKLYL